jgi:hypothetical protein
MAQYIGSKINQAVVDEYYNYNAGYEIRKPEPDAGITMHANGGDEMIKVTKDSFYVRGKKVEQDDKEAETVYNAFKQWLSWAQLQR